MKNTLLFLLTAAATASLVAGPANAQVYQWKDENGRTVVSDTPPPGKYKQVRRAGDAPAAPVTPAAEPGKPGATSAPPTTADKNLDFKKRQQEAQEKADKEAREQKEAQLRKDNCAQSQQALRTLESGQRIASINEKGEREIYDDKRRQAEAERARQAVAEWCK